MKTILALLFSCLTGWAAANLPPISHSMWTTNNGNTGSNLFYKLVWKTNTVFTEGVAFTPGGGLAFLWTNGTGSNSVLGQVVSSKVAVNAGRTYNTLISNGTNTHNVLGVVTQGGIANGQLVWIMCRGFAWVMQEFTAGSGLSGQIAFASITQDGKIGLQTPVDSYMTNAIYLSKKVGWVVQDSGANSDGTNLLWCFVAP